MIQEDTSMKKLATSLMMLALLLCLVLNVCFAEEAAQPAVAFDLSALVTREAGTEEAPVQEIVLMKGKTAKIAWELTNVEDAKKVKVTWKSSDAKVATVQAGTVTAKGAGTATITATAKLSDGSEISASTQVTVEVAVSQLSVAKKTLTVNAGYSSDPVAVKISPATATCQELIWTSADESVATVSADGVITGVTAGKTTVTATSAENSAKPKTVTITVTVAQPVTGVTLDQTSITLAKGKTQKLTASVQPDNAASKKITWTTSDPKVATVAAGTVTAKAPGTAVITAAAADGSGFFAECTVEVYATVASATMSSAKANVFMETEGTQLSVVVKPEGASYYEVAWSSSDETVATVDANGLVTPVKGGKATITATITNTLNPSAQPKKATCAVSVVQGVKQVSIDGPESFKLAKGKTQKLTASVSPADATNAKVTWSSSDPKVATVTNGQVSAKGVGTATLTCTAADGSGASDTVTVSVYQGVTAVKASRTKVAVTEGKTTTLAVSVSPADAANKKVNWTSSNTYIATVDANGKVTAKNAGQCTITATSADNSSKKTSVTVIVEPKIPLDAVKFTRSGYFGAYYEFAVTFKNLTKTRTIKYIEFDLKYTYNGETKTFYSFYDSTSKLAPGKTKQIGWWDQLGYRLSYCSNFRIYLKSVRYSDGTWDYFSSDNLIGWF